MSGFEVRPAELRTHADKIDRLASRLGEALFAARHVSMQKDAYGKICSFIPPLMNDIERDAYEALAAGQNGLTEIATNIRHTADEYDRRDDDAAVMFGTL
jgi:hypothetical protein